MSNYVKITNQLKDLGVPANLLGFHYARYAIELMMKDISLMNKITTQLYPEVALQFDTTPSKVERAIRHAIEVAWYRGNRETHTKLFGYTVDMLKGCPKNAEFIVTVADYILMLENEVTE